MVALLHSWAGALAGLPFVLLGVAERWAGKLLIAKRLYVAAVVAAFLGANFLAWKDQKDAVDDAVARLQDQEVTNGELSQQLNDEKEYSTPNFQVSLQNVWFFPVVRKMWELYMIVDVRNTGAPSIIDYWEAYAGYQKGDNTYVLPLHRIDTPFSFPTVFGRMSYKPSYWLPDRTLPTPVQRGADIKGILISIIRLRHPSDLNLRTIRISFNDVNGDTHWATSNPYTINSAAVSPPTLDR
jgi:hypothetical protein